MTEAGVGEVVDFMPTSPAAVATDRHRLVRLVRCVRGQMTFDGRHRAAVRLRPRAARDARDRGRRGVHAAATSRVTLHIVREPDDERLAQRRGRRERRPARASSPCRPARCAGWCSRPARPGRPGGCASAEVERLLDETVDFWKSWLAQSTYTGRWRETLHRSAITLKLMTYAPTGGLVAAPTAGLPEQVGGERNWDYRYTWVRDASFSVYALLGLGFTEEAAAFARLAARPRARAGGQRRGAAQHHVPRRRLAPTSTRRSSSTGRATGARARCGSATAPPDQLQLDIYGEAMDSIYFADQRGLQVGHQGWLAIARPARLARATTGTSPRRGSGRPAAAARTSPTAG